VLVSSFRGYSNNSQVRLKGRNDLPRMKGLRAVVLPVLALSGQPSHQGLLQDGSVEPMIDGPAISSFGGG